MRSSGSAWRLLREQSRADCLAESLARKLKPELVLAEKYEPLCARIDTALKAIESANQAPFLKDELLAALTEARACRFITDAEFTHLAVRKGNLTEEEWIDMRSHVTKSFRLLRQIPWPDELRDLAEVAYTHHEKRDGSGYPRRLKASEIHFDGQILCVADIYDALTAKDRPYKKGLPPEQAKTILLEEAGQGKLLPGVGETFLRGELQRNGVQSRKFHAYPGGVPATLRRPRLWRGVRT